MLKSALGVLGFVSLKVPIRHALEDGVWSVRVVSFFGTLEEADETVAKFRLTSVVLHPDDAIEITDRLRGALEVEDVDDPGKDLAYVRLDNILSLTVRHHDQQQVGGS
jgi:hypothetical protein